MYRVFVNARKSGFGEGFKMGFGNSSKNGFWGGLEKRVLGTARKTGLHISPPDSQYIVAVLHEASNAALLIRVTS